MQRLTPHVFIGVDLGQRRDPAAIAVLLRTRETNGAIDPVTREYVYVLRFDLIHVERWPLGTPYTKIVDDLQYIVSQLTSSLHGHWPVLPGHLVDPLKTICVDSTGVGLPVVELIRDADIRASLVPLSITGGDKPHDGTVPRRDLVSILKILLERDYLAISDQIQNRDQLIEELTNFGDHKTEKSDDIAIAVALAAWKAAEHISFPTRHPQYPT
jgi:hypothetical protein